MRLKDNTRTPDCATAPAKKYPRPPIDRGTLECVAAYYEAKRDYGKKSHFRSRMSLVPNVPIPPTNMTRNCGRAILRDWQNGLIAR
jgi:hypothetical protein